ncbi:hypothetical protein ACFQY7_12125 [Actinomadura luteofluorescens]|uniref:hypothetical protein n=1 Tax=Actinomadura luteofluorescens TaxID=46163 RepID=UPI00363EC14F
MLRVPRVDVTVKDALAASALAGAAAAAAVLWPGVRELDAPGALLLVAAHVPLALIRRWLPRACWRWWPWCCPTTWRSTSTTPWCPPR